MNITVNTDELRQVATNIDSIRNEITGIYDSSIKSLFTQSEEAIVASGLDFNEFRGVFDQVFYQLDDDMANLAYALTNTIIPKYENLGSYIRVAFNENFANEMSALLERIRS